MQPETLVSLVCAVVAEVFAELIAAEGRVDVVVNAVWGGYERFVGVGELSFGPFWEQPLALWDSMHRAGVRAAYVGAALAARAMVERGQGRRRSLSYRLSRAATASSRSEHTRTVT